jgi:hypothetical protein
VSHAHCLEDRVLRPRFWSWSCSLQLRLSLGSCRHAIRLGGLRHCCVYIHNLCVYGVIVLNVKSKNRDKLWSTRIRTGQTIWEFFWSSDAWLSGRYFAERPPSAKVASPKFAQIRSAGLVPGSSSPMSAYVRPGRINARPRCGPYTFFHAQPFDSGRLINMAIAWGRPQ